jgi:hypothetical protein
MFFVDQLLQVIAQLLTEPRIECGARRQRAKAEAQRIEEPHALRRGPNDLGDRGRQPLPKPRFFFELCTAGAG